MGITGERMVDARGQVTSREYAVALKDGELAKALMEVAAVFSSGHRNHLLIVEASERLLHGENYGEG